MAVISARQIYASNPTFTLALAVDRITRRTAPLVRESVSLAGGLVPVHIYYLSGAK